MIPLIARYVTYEYVTYRTPDEMCAVAQRIGELAKGWGVTAATCGEIKDLDPYGVEHNRCIDDRLIAKCFHRDAELMKFIGAQFVQGDMFGATEEERHDSWSTSSSRSASRRTRSGSESSVRRRSSRW